MIALACDHVGFALKVMVMEYLDGKGLAYKDFGTYGPERAEYPEYALAAARAVASGECGRGIVICGTGVGVSIAANKVRGIRCAVCSEPYTARLSRQHNDANMLALGARVAGPGLALLIVEEWLNGEFEGGRHAARVEQIAKIELNP